jgi:hypothetical protein
VNRPVFLDKPATNWTAPERIAVEAAVEQVIIQLRDDHRMRENFALMYGEPALDALLLD